MRILLDTHFLVWAITDTAKLSAVERAMFADPTHDLTVSVISLWEIRIKWQSLDRDGRRKGLLSPDMALRYADDNGLKLAALNPADVIEQLHPPLGHRDPFDEMLLTHAQRLGAKLMTRDGLLASHPLALQL